MASNPVGFQPGNQLAAKSQRITRMLERIINEDDGAKLYRGLTRLMDSFEAGEPWAIEQVFNRVQGKPAQSVSLDADGSPVQFTSIQMLVVKHEPVPKPLNSLDNVTIEHKP